MKVVDDDKKEEEFVSWDRYHGEREDEEYEMNNKILKPVYNIYHLPVIYPTKPNIRIIINISFKVVGNPRGGGDGKTQLEEEEEEEEEEKEVMLEDHELSFEMVGGERKEVPKPKFSPIKASNSSSSSSSSSPRKSLKRIVIWLWRDNPLIEERFPNLEDEIESGVISEMEVGGKQCIQLTLEQNNWKMYQDHHDHVYVVRAFGGKKKPEFQHVFSASNLTNESASVFYFGMSKIPSHDIRRKILYQHSTFKDMERLFEPTGDMRNEDGEDDFITERSNKMVFVHDN